MKVCGCGISVNVNNYCEILILRMVYALHIAATHYLIMGCASNEIVVRIFVFT